MTCGFCFIAILYFTSFERHHTHNWPQQESYGESVASQESDMVTSGLSETSRGGPETKSQNEEDYPPYTDREKLQHDDHKAQIFMAGFTFIGLLIGGAGLYLIARTLIETQKASDVAKRGTDAAWRALEIAQDTAEKQLRAYIVIESIEQVRVDYNNPPVFIATMRNTGQTPAKRIDRFVAFTAVSEDVRPRFAFRDAEGNLPDLPSYILGPEKLQTIEIGMRRQVAPDIVNAMFSGEVKCYGGGVISYDDIYGKRRRTIFRFEAIPQSEGRFRVNLLNRHNRIS